MKSISRAGLSSAAMALGLLFSCVNTTPPEARADGGLDYDVEVLEAPSGPTGFGSEMYADAEAMLLIGEIEKVVLAVAEENPGRAREILKSSLEKLAALRRRNEGSDVLPITVAAEVMNTAPGGLPEIKALRGQAQEAMRAGRLPEARKHLSCLVSELRVSTTSVSLEAWASGMNRADGLIAANRGEEACEILAVTFENVTEETAIRPLPIALAEKELDLAATDGRANVDVARSRLAEAALQLKRAEELGYTGPETGYKELKASLRSARKNLKSAAGPAGPVRRPLTGRAA